LCFLRLLGTCSLRLCCLFLLTFSLAVGTALPLIPTTHGKALLPTVPPVVDCAPSSQEIMLVQRNPYSLSSCEFREFWFCVRSFGFELFSSLSLFRPCYLSGDLSPLEGSLLETCPPFFIPIFFSLTSDSLRVPPISSLLVRFSNAVFVSPDPLVATHVPLLFFVV